MTVSWKKMSFLLLISFYILVSCTHESTEIPEIEVPISITDSIKTDGFKVQKYGKTWIFFAEVDKAGDYFRRMFIEESAVVALKSTGQLPDNALIAMETWFGNSQSTVYIRQKNGNTILSGSFSPSSPNYTVRDDGYCNGCHGGASKTNDTYTLPLLVKAVNRNATQYIVCNMTSFNPCDLSVYQGN